MDITGEQDFSLLGLDTTRGSISHKAFNYLYRPSSWAILPLLKIYAVSVLVTFFPLLTMAILGHFPITEITAIHKLPFLYDGNVLFMFLVSFPSLVICVVNDQRVLLSALKSVGLDGALFTSMEDATRLRFFWQKRFQVVNHVGQVLGLIVGSAVAYFNFIAYTPVSVGYWIAANGSLLPVGYVLLYSVFFFYFLIPLLILRVITIAFLLHSIVSCSHLRILPAHPDMSGGLRPLGHMVLRYQYLLTVFSLNIVMMMAVPFHYLQASSTLYNLTVIAVVMYLFLGPISFMALLLPLHNGMLRAKRALKEPISQRLCLELESLSEKMKLGEVTTKENEELIERLDKVSSVIGKLPVWPFDANIMRKFFAVYAFPLLASISKPYAKTLFDMVKNFFQ